MGQPCSKKFLGKKVNGKARYCAICCKEGFSEQEVSVDCRHQKCHGDCLSCFLHQTPSQIKGATHKCCCNDKEKQKEHASKEERDRQKCCGGICH